MTDKIASQKAGDLETYSQVFESYAIERRYKPLKTHTIHLPKYLTQAHALSMVKNKLISHYATEQAEQAWDMFNYGSDDLPLFVRVCPLNARPGVLESLPVFSKTELEENLIRIMEVMFSKDTADPPLYKHGLCEPEGCIIVQPFINAHASAVMAPGVFDAEIGEHTQGYIVMGRDNDGITAALDGLKITLPVSGRHQWLRQMWKTLGMDPAHYELEFVSLLKDSNGNNVVKADGDDAIFDTMHTGMMVSTENYITQLRGCAGHQPINPPPKGVTVQGFVPKGKVKVTEVFVCEGDMEDYSASLEERLRQKLPKGFVISHPDGNMASHAAAQARAYKVSYIINDVTVGSTWVEPATGWVVDDPKYKASPYDPVDYINDFKEGLTVGLHHWTRMYVHLGHHFHQFAAAPMSDPKNTAFLGGVYAGWLVNATLAVGLGEMRNAKGQRRSNTPDVFGTLNAIFKGKWVESDGYKTTSPPEIRQHYYYTMEKTPLTMLSMHGVFEWLVRMFRNGWSSSYGGTKYMESIQKGQALLLKAGEFVKDACEDTLLALIESVNICKNAVHNNGMFFNKFVKKSTMDMSTAVDGCEPDLEQMFNVYYAARAAVSKRGVRPELHDVADTMQYVLSRGNSKWKKTPIMLDEAAPQLLKDSINEMVARGKGHLLHSGGGEVTQPGSAKFVPCGHEKCEVCSSHITTLEVVAAQQYQQALDDATAEMGLSFVDMGLHFDMWPVQENEGSSLTQAEEWVIKTMEDIKASNDTPDADELLKCFNISNAVTTNENVRVYVMKMISKVVSRLPTKDRIELLSKVTNTPVIVPEEVAPIDTLKGKSTSNGKGVKKNMIEFFTQLQEQLTEE
tara:strand:- start:2922 stop:5477 length:2556 start_codon:yes stop_codon:yes gene_type:complete